MSWPLEPQRGSPPPLGPAPTLAPSSARSGHSHQTSRQVSYSIGCKNLPLLLVQRRVQAEGGRWHTPAWHRAPPNPARGTKGRRRWLTFRRSPLFGLQRREGAHDGPHGSEDLCATWDPLPCPSPPLERNLCGSSTPNWRREKKKAPGSSPACSLVFSERGAGALGAFSFLLQPRTCTDSQGQPLPTSLRNRAGPLRAPRAEDAAPQPGRCRTRGGAPAGRGSRASGACGAGAALRPPLLPRAPLPSRRSGWLSGAGYQS